MLDKKLIKIQNSHKGQKILFEKYYSQMHALALRYVKTRENTEDVLSESFVRIFNNISSFIYQGEGSLKRWIKTIVINEALRMLNKRKLEFSDEVEINEIEFSDEINGSIDMEFFLSVVNTLPDGYRIIFMLFVIEEFSHKEIAKKLNISISTSKSQLFKARSLIMKKLNKIEHYETVANRKTV